MEKITRCQCGSCGVNIEFDAGQLALGEVRRGSCPACNAEMDFYQSPQFGLKPEDFAHNEKKTATFGKFKTEKEILRQSAKKPNEHLENNKNPMPEDAPITLALSSFIALGVLLWFVIVANKVFNTSVDENLSPDWLLASIPMLALVYDQLAEIIWGQHWLIVRARISLYSMALIPIIFILACKIIGKGLAKDTDNNFSGDPDGATFLIEFILGVFVLIPWGFCVWNTFERRCSSCRRLDAMRNAGASIHVSSRDTTQKEMRQAFVQHQFGRPPDEMITYFQDVKVKEHTSKTARRCIYCGNGDDHYSSYTTKY